MATYRSRTRSIALAAAAGGNPASVSTTTGLVDVSSLTFRGLECDWSSISWTVETPLLEDNTSTTGFEPRPPSIDSMCGAAGVPGRRATADLSITGIPMRSWGQGAVGGAVSMVDANEMPLTQLLASSLSLTDQGGALGFVSGPGANAGEFLTVTATLKAGEVIIVDVDGRLEAALITKVTGAGPYTITVGTYFSRALTNASADEFHRGMNFSSLTGSNTGVVGAALAAEVDTLAGTMTCALGRASALKFYLDKGFWHLDATIHFEYADIDISATSEAVNPNRTLGAVAKFRGVRPCCSASAAPVDIAAGFSSTRLALNEIRDDIAVSLDFTLSTLAATDQIVAASELEIVGTAITATLGFNDIKTAMRDDVENERSRQFVFPGCPISDGVGTDNGFAIVISGGFSTEDPSVLGMDGDLLEQRLSLTAGKYGGDDGSEIYKNAPFHLFMGGT